LDTKLHAHGVYKLTYFILTDKTMQLTCTL